MDTVALRPRAVGEILDAAIKLYVRNARTLMGLAAIVAIPVQALTTLVLLSISGNGGQTATNFSVFGFNSTNTTTGSTTTISHAQALALLGGGVVLIVVFVLSTLLSTAASVKAVSDAYLDQPPSVKGSLAFALRRLPALLGMEILYLLGLILGALPLLVPLVFLYVGWSVRAPALLVERTGPARALGRSLRLVEGRWWACAGVLLVATIMASVVAELFRVLLGSLATIPGQPTVLAAVLATTISSAVAAILTQPFVAAVTTVLYYDLRMRKEGYDLQLIAEQLGHPAELAAQLGAPPPPPPIAPTSVGVPGGPPFWPPPPDWEPGVSGPQVPQAPAPAPRGVLAPADPGPPSYWPPRQDDP